MSDTTGIEIVANKQDIIIRDRIARTKLALTDCDEANIADVDLILRDVEEVLIILEHRKRRREQRRDAARRRLIDDVKSTTVNQ